MSVFPLIKEPQIALFVVSIVFAVINIPVVALRFLARRKSWGQFSLSDAALLAAFICTTALCSVVVAQTLTAAIGWHAVEAFLTHGLGFVQTLGQTSIAEAQLWAASVFFTKLSILLVLAELFSVVSYVKIATRIGMAFAFALWLVQFIGCLSICVPIWKWWEVQSVSGWCATAQYRLFLSTSIIHTVADFFILVLPVPCLWALRLPSRTKVGLVFVFSGGLLATFVSIGRVYAISRVDYMDPTYGIWLGSLFTVIEPSVEIWIACVPHIRALFNQKTGTTGKVSVGSEYGPASSSVHPRHTSDASDQTTLKGVV